MAQISLYMEDTVAERLNQAAKARNCSLSKYVASLIQDKLREAEADEAQKKMILGELRGALRDMDIAEPPEIPEDRETQRRFDLL